MKRIFVIISLLLLPGCGLLPKRTEYFQQKVKSMPAKTADHREAEKQAAAFVAAKTEQVVTNAIAEGCSTNVVAPAVDANTAAEALSRSLGPPSDPWRKNALALAARLDKLESKLDAKLDAYRAAVQANVGKKIEGTGLFSIGYFTKWGILLVAVALIWLGLKAYGAFNPVVGLGMNIFGRVSSGVLSNGFHQVVAAGESFKDYLEKSALSPADKAAVKDLFVRAQRETQSPEVQTIIKEITK